MPSCKHAWLSGFGADRNDRQAFIMKMSRPSPGKVFACLSLLAAASLCFLLGAAVMHFRLPSFSTMRNAFIGFQAWRERSVSDGPDAASLENPPKNAVTIDHPDK